MTTACYTLYTVSGNLISKYLSKRNILFPIALGHGQIRITTLLDGRTEG